MAIAPFTDINPFGDAAHELRELGIEETLTDDSASGVGISLGMLASAVRSSTLVWTMTLRPGIQFQDGNPVDAEAVVACLKLDIANAFSPDDISTGTLAVTGPLTFTVTTKEPVGDLPAEFANFEQYEIFDASAYEAAGKDIASLVHRGIYTGPFEPVSLTNTGMTLKANPHYWGGKVALPSAKVLFVSDPQAEVAAVEDGEADLAIDPPASAAQTLRGNSSAFYVNTRYANVGTWAIIDQKAGSVLADPMVRRAVEMAIDYKALVAGLGPAGVVAATGLYPTYAPYEVTTQVYDPTKAEAMLASDGWKMGSGGVRTKGGKQLSFTYLWCNSQGPASGQLGLVLQQQLKAVGIDMKIRQIASTFTVPSSPAQWGMTVVSIGMQGEGAPYSTLESFLATNQGGNLGGINSPKLNDLIAQEDSATGTQAEYRILRQIGSLVANNADGIMLSYYSSPFVTSRAYRGIKEGGELQFLTAGLRPAS